MLFCTQAVKEVPPEFCNSVIVEFLAPNFALGVAAQNCLSWHGKSWKSQLFMVWAELTVTAEFPFLSAAFPFLEHWDCIFWAQNPEANLECCCSFWVQNLLFLSTEFPFLKAEVIFWARNSGGSVKCYSSIMEMSNHRVSHNILVYVFICPLLSEVWYNRE